jgi:hypothetical protein
VRPFVSESGIRPGCAAELADPKRFAAGFRPLLADLENEALQSDRVALLFLVSLAIRRTTIQVPAGESLCAPLRSEPTLSEGQIPIAPRDRVAASCLVWTYGALVKIRANRLMGFVKVAGRQGARR